MKVSAQYAEEHFADILHAADNGEEVEIARADKSTYRLELVKPIPFNRTTPRILGEGVGEMIVPSWNEWKAIDKEVEREPNDQPGVTSRTGTPSGRPRSELWGAWEGLIVAPDQDQWDEIHHQFLGEMPDVSKAGGVGD